MIEGFSEFRGERRSFFCPNKLWDELNKQTKNLYSVSQFIKMAVIEKMIREEPEKKEFFRDLI